MPGGLSRLGAAAPGVAGDTDPVAARVTLSPAPDCCPCSDNAEGDASGTGDASADCDAGPGRRTLKECRQRLAQRLDADDFHPARLQASGGSGGEDNAGEAALRSLRQAGLGLGDGPHFPRQPDFSEDERLGVERDVSQ
jgi:hypothetical protein